LAFISGLLFRWDIVAGLFFAIARIIETPKGNEASFTVTGALLARH